MQQPSADSLTANYDLLRLYWSHNALHLSVGAILIVLLVIPALFFLVRIYRDSARWANEFEVDEAELGVGNHKIKLRPNRQSSQIAYKLWIELSTRKVGLPIDFQHDVISEVYDSWYEFFRVTRELLKEVPASQLRTNENTNRLVSLAIDVLNEGLRPHLTTWQSRFRHWYKLELGKASTADPDVQTIQARYPRYDELKADMERVNASLMAYRHTIRRMVFDPK